MKKTSAMLAFLLAVFTAGSALASDLLYEQKPPKLIAYHDAGPYAAFRGGALWLQPISGDLSPTAYGTGDFGTGYDVSAALGYKFDDYWIFQPRVEVEGGYQSSTIDSISVYSGGTTFGPFGATGNVSTWYGGVNGLLDIKLFDFGLVPYVGGGVNYGNVCANNLALTGLGTVLDDCDGAFGYNFQVGASYDITKNTTFEIGYTWRRFQGVQLTGALPGGVPAVDQDVDSQAVKAGFRVKL